MLKVAIVSKYDAVKSARGNFLGTGLSRSGSSIIARVLSIARQRGRLEWTKSASPWETEIRIFVLRSRQGNEAPRYVEATVGIVIENGGKRGSERGRSREGGRQRKIDRESERGACTLAWNTPKRSDKSISGEKRCGKQGLQGYRLL